MVTLNIFVVDATAAILLLSEPSYLRRKSYPELLFFKKKNSNASVF